MTGKEPKLAEIAARITTHLRRFEADPAINADRDIYFCPHAWVAGPKVFIRAVSYQLGIPYTKAEALAILAAYDAGCTDHHTTWRRKHFPGRQP